MPTLANSVVFVTGANGGIGTQLVHDALARGARKVYATARSPRTWDDDRIVTLTLDVTDSASVAAAAEAATDVTVLINNAGAIPPTRSLLDSSEAEIRANFELNFFGPLVLTRAFASTLAAHSGSALINIHSIASWIAFGGAYSASKAALWSATNSIRLEFAPQGIHVTGVHVGFVDTAMAAHDGGPKVTTEDLVEAIFDAVEADQFEVVADDVTASVKAALSGSIETMYPQLGSSEA